jgi:hypothetical protein
MNVAPFNNQGNTYTFTADVTAPTPVQVLSPTGAANNYLITNVGNATVFLGIGVDAATATANAVTPTVGSPQRCIPVLPGTAQTFSLAANAFFTGVAASASIVYVTPGDGM